MRGNDSLEHVFAAIKAFGGYFVFEDEEGTEYIIQRKDAAEQSDALSTQPQDVQLTFTAFSTENANAQAQRELEEDITEINRAIASLNLDDQEQVDESEAEPLTEESEVPPPRRVRFEPIRGDLPPELQE